MQDSFLVLLFILKLSVFCVFFLLYFNDLLENRKFKRVFALKIALLSLIFLYAIPLKTIFTTQWVTLLFIFLIPFFICFFPKIKKLFFSPQMILHIFLVCNCPFLIFLIFVFLIDTDSYKFYSTLLASFSILLLCFYISILFFGFIHSERYFLSHDCLTCIWILLNFIILIGLGSYVSYGKEIIKHLSQSLYIDIFSLFGMMLFFAIPLHIFFLFFLIKKFKIIKIKSYASPSQKSK